MFRRNHVCPIRCLTAGDVTDDHIYARRHCRALVEASLTTIYLFEKELEDNYRSSSHNVMGNDQLGQKNTFLSKVPASHSVEQTRHF